MVWFTCFGLSLLANSAADRIILHKFEIDDEEKRCFVTKNKGAVKKKTATE